MSVVLIIFQGSLLVYLLTLLWCLAGLFRPEPRRTGEQPAVAVIVAARNGDPHLSRLLAQLREQDYPASRLEYVIVDDGLSASSRAVLDEAAGRDARIKVVNSSAGDPRLTHKKRALDAGIRSSQGELLLFTDVDCQVRPGWVSALVSCFTPDVDYVLGWSQVAARAGLALDSEAPEARRPLTLFEQLDFTMLMLVARGAALMGTPWASSGQNQGYRRSVYERAGGFEELAGRLQGDDSLFLQVARRRARARITFATAPDSRAVTDPADSLKQLLYQRVRWAGDAAAMWRFNPAFFPILLAAFGANALLLVLAGAALANSAAVLPVLIPGLLLKALVEGVLLWLGGTRVFLGNLRRHFPLWFLLEIPYMTFVGLASFWGNRIPWRWPAARTGKTSRD